MKNVDTDIEKVGVGTLLDDLCSIFFPRTPTINYLRIDQSMDGEHPLQFAFCLAMANLEICQPSYTSSLSSGDPRNDLAPNMVRLMNAVGYKGHMLGPGYETFRTSWIGKQTHGLFISTFITQNVYYGLQGRKPNIFSRLISIAMMTRKKIASNQLPSVKKIEFVPSWYLTGDTSPTAEHTTPSRATSLRPRFPMVSPNRVAISGKKGRYFHPFSGDEWWAWYTTRVRDLARHIDEGEWCGYYTYDLHLGSRVDPIMENIRFRRTNPDEDTNGDTDGDTDGDMDEDKYSVEALDCVDGIGRFTLRGVVNASDAACTIQIRKEYANHGFDWQGRVTPLGICGTYSHWWNRTLQPSGYFWLWKREWMDAPGM